MPVAMQGAGPGPAVEEDYKCEINEDHGHQPHGKNVKACLTHTDLVRYPAEGVKEACQQRKTNGLAPEPETSEPDPTLSRLELDAIGARRRNEDARNHFDRKSVPREHVGPEGNEDGCEGGHGIAQGEISLAGSIGPGNGEMVGSEKGG